MSMAHLVALPKPLPSPYPSHRRITADPPRRVVKISALGRRTFWVALVATQASSAVGAGAEPNKEEAIVANASPAASNGPSLPLPEIPTWAKWVFGAIFCVAIPFYKKILRFEGAVETAVETVEKVAETVEKVATDVAKDLPESSPLRQQLLKIERIAERADQDAEKVEDFIHKVDNIKEEVEEIVEPILEEGKRIHEKETQEKETVTASDSSKEKETSPNSDSIKEKETSPNSDSSKEKETSSKL